MIDQIMKSLDEFVYSRADKTYVLPPPFTSPNTAIQQDRAEIMKFVEIILNLKNKFNICELGFGPMGGTHYLWRMLFDKVLTVEWDSSKIANKTFETDDKSLFIFGDTRSLETFEKVKNQMPMIDVLFMDASHETQDIEKEWNLYSSLVKSNGIIAYHDSNQDYGVKEFLAKLESGLIDGKKHAINYIHLSHVGLAYEII
jgi:hypothetical protein